MSYLTRVPAERVTPFRSRDFLKRVTLKEVAIPVNKPEVMSPAGHWPQMHAAIEAGADAVYFGLTHFTARAKVGFTLAELPEAMKTMHKRGVRGYLTYNSLVFDSELADAGRGLAAIAEAGVDAIIVQDLAVVKLAKEIAPDLEIHGSTQMSITDAAGVRAAQKLGVSRIVLARELSLHEIRALRRQTDCHLEVFVHGALCVSYSGQCFSSEAWGGRSANRGQCAQACRLPYQMLVDGKLQPLGDARYLLSPGDLYALEQIPELVDIGVSALKIEGRYKDVDYVALTTRAYRKAVDDACAGKAASPNPETKQQLEQVYSRGLGPYFLSGTNHQTVVRGRAPRHRGVLIGSVIRTTPQGVVVESSSLSPSFKPGDGVVFDAASWRDPAEDEEGGRIYEILPAAAGSAELRFANGAIHTERIRAGDLVWRTHDPDIAKLVHPYVRPAAPVTRQPLRVEAVAKEGARLKLTWSLIRHPELRVKVVSESELSKAEQRALDADYLQEQLGRLGNTAYQLEELTLTSQGSPFAPSSVLNRLRRRAVEELETLQAAAPARKINQRLLVDLPKVSSPSADPPRLHLLLRTLEQLDAALETRPASITLDYLDLYGLKPSLERVKASGIEARIASPRVLKPGEERIADFLLNCDVPVLVRSTGLLETLEGRRHAALTGDFSLNAANAISARELLNRGLDRLTPSHDLNASQIAALALQMDPGTMEVIAYQHLPVFHTEHCVFCRFLSTGTSFKDCGRPCEKHDVALKDSEGRAHPVLADVGCRNTVFGAQAQEGSLHLEAWLAAGISHFRLEFVQESGAQVSAIAAAFQEALAGRIRAQDLNRKLRSLSPKGVTEGSLFVPSTASLLPVLQ
jgi:putative protease